MVNALNILYFSVFIQHVYIGMDKLNRIQTECSSIFESMKEKKTVNITNLRVNLLNGIYYILIVSCKNIIQFMLGEVNNRLAGSSQQDATEGLLYLMNILFENIPVS